MLQVFKIFLIFSFLPSICFAWNQSCYSPVQVAAYMSKPKKSSRGVSQASLSKMKSKIRALERAMDKAEGELQDSLDRDKLKAKPSSVAGDIRDYIEDKQDGWDCAKGGQSSLFFFPSLITKAYAQEDPFGDLNETLLESDLKDNPTGDDSSEEALKQNSNNEDSEKKAQYVEQSNTPTERTKASDSNLEQTTNIDISGKKTQQIKQSQPKTPRKKSPQELCAQRGLEYDSSRNRCVLRNPSSCKNTGGTWDKDEGCICPRNMRTDGSKCIKKLPPAPSGLTPANVYKKSDKKASSVEGTKTPTKRKKTQKELCDQKGADYVWSDGACRLTQKKVCENKGAYWNWDGKECKCPSPYKIDGAKCREKTDQEKCKDQGKVWKDGKCLSQDEIDRQNCEKKPGMEWIGGECKKSLATKCKDRPGNWVWNKGACQCLAPYITEGETCREQTSLEKCKEEGRTWNEENRECCPQGKNIIYQGRCVSDNDKKKTQCEDKGENYTYKNGKCIECPKWKKHSSFKANGKVSSSFCDEYAKNKGDCKSALSDLKEYADDLEDLKDRLDDLQDELRQKSRLEYETETSSTEASGVCLDCLKRVIRASQPSAGQVIGQTFGALLGAGISVAGYKVGRTAQRDANMMRVRQGYPALYDGFSLSGAGAGYPFMANSLYGLTRAGTPVGGWSCTPTVSPYGHSFNAGYGYGHNMRYY